VELRQTPGGASDATSATMVARRAGFILQNGSIVEIDGSSNLRIPAGIDQNLYLVLWHRNHLGIMSATPLLNTGEIYTWNFTVGAGQAFGGVSALKDISPGNWGKKSGDGDGNELIQDADKNDVWKSQSGMSGYKEGDFNLSGQVNNLDKNQKWLPNLGSGTFVPE